MRIDTISLTNFKNFKKLDGLQFSSGVNLFVGINGSGKTSLLEAITIGMGGFFASQPAGWQRHPVDDELRIENEQRVKELSVYFSTDFAGIGKWGRKFYRDTNSPDSKDQKNAREYGEKILASFENTEDKTLAPLLSYYSTQRLHSDGRESKKQQYDPYQGRRNGYLLWQDERAIKRTLTAWLSLEAYNEYAKARAGVTEKNLAFDNVMTGIREAINEFVDNPGTVSNVRIFDRVIREVIKTGGKSERETKVFLEIEEQKSLPLDYYSDGFRNLLYLIVDLVWRASQLNPWLTFEELKAQTFGIVAIDEIDLHLHPTWQAKAVPFLQKLFPCVQFFITTHSPTVVANFEPREDLDEIYQIQNDQVVTLGTNYFGHDINSVLENPLQANHRNLQVKNLFEEFRSVCNSKTGEERIRTLKALLTQLETYVDGSDSEFLEARFLFDQLEAGK